MYCKNCGYMLEGKPSYCSNCGAIVDTRMNFPNQGPGPIPQGGMLPPPVPPHMQVHPNRNKAILPVFIVGLILSYLMLILLVVIAIIGFISNVTSTDYNRMIEKYGLEGYGDTANPFESFEDYGYSYDEDAGTDFDAFGDEGEEYYYDYGFGNADTMYYSYYELPYVASIDSDLRFTITDYVVEEGLSTYSFDFAGATEEEYYMAIDEYMTYLMEWNGYYLDQDYTDQAYAATGVYTIYLTEGQNYLGITTGTADGESDTLISIFLPDEESVAQNY